MTTLASVFPLASAVPAAPALVVPVYIYPVEGAWEPLFAAARAHPELAFMCIINPGNGPGPDRLPDANYASALGQLCTLPNVQPLGYVHCSYGDRNPESIMADVDKYSAWHSESGGAFRVDGVFIDEAPWDPVLRPYLANLGRHIRAAWRTSSTSAKPPTPHALEAPHGSHQSPMSNILRLPSRSKGVVVYNPGAVVSIGHFSDADGVVVFEQSEKHWYDYFLGHGLNQIPQSVRHKCIAMVHSQLLPSKASPVNTHIPRCLTNDESFAAIALANQIRRLGFGGLFLTDQLDGGYTRWPAAWHAVAASLSLS